MNSQDILHTFIEKCKSSLLQNKKMLKLLNSKGIKESFIFENFKLGFSDHAVYQSIGNAKPLVAKLHETGLFKNNVPSFTDLVTIPIYDENKTIANIVFCDPSGKAQF